MKWIDTSEMIPQLGDYYYCKVDTKRDCIVKCIVEYAKYPNGKYDWDIGDALSNEKLGVDAEVIEWLDEDGCKKSYVDAVKEFHRKKQEDCKHDQGYVTNTVGPSKCMLCGKPWM